MGEGIKTELAESALNDNRVNRKGTETIGENSEMVEAAEKGDWKKYEELALGRRSSYGESEERVKRLVKEKKDKEGKNG